ncbi:hypothetical protein OBBRIDRAFT_663816 [Obba rivulosa]|uniref:F-box domain-containing protein n=1 Tax=Obba rivulosa TaxID=1052685 RepID=A0A8E2DNC1_9APHY|nr:hypothetical protein OBBRIDRAFT_663816 [Obba rivulosa]
MASGTGPTQVVHGCSTRITLFWSVSAISVTTLCIASCLNLKLDLFSFYPTYSSSLPVSSLFPLSSDLRRRTTPSSGATGISRGPPVSRTVHFFVTTEGQRSHTLRPSSLNKFLTHPILIAASNVVLPVILSIEVHVVVAAEGRHRPVLYLPFSSTFLTSALPRISAFMLLHTVPIHTSSLVGEKEYRHSADTDATARERSTRDDPYTEAGLVTSKIAHTIDTKHSNIRGYNTHSMKRADARSNGIAVSRTWSPICDSVISDRAIQVTVVSYPRPQLPEDVWWLIVQAIDDYRTVMACGCTCTGLRMMVQRFLPSDSEFRLRDRRSLTNLCRRHWLHTHHIRTISLKPDMLTTSAVELAGKITRLRSIIVVDLEGHRPISLNMRTMLALRTFKNVTQLDLLGVCFATFADIGRLLCAFLSLKYLGINRVSCVHDTQHTHGANSIGLESLRLALLESHVVPRSDLHSAKYLLTAPLLAKTISELTIESTDTTLSRLMPRFAIHPLAYLSNLRDLTIKLNECSTSNPGYTASIFMTHIPPNRIARLCITFDYLQQHQKDPYFALERCCEYFNGLDEILSSPHFSGLSEVRFKLWDVGLRNVQYLRMAKSRLFLRLQSREIFEFTASETSMGSPTAIIVRMGAGG